MNSILLQKITTKMTDGLLPTHALVPLLLLLLLLVTPARAEMITFNDNSESINVAVVGSRVITPQCITAQGFERCFVDLLPPLGTKSFLGFGGGGIVNNPFLLPTGELIAEVNPQLNIGGFATISDSLTVEVIANQNTLLPALTLVTFTSADINNEFCRIGIDCFLETGAIQLGATIVWCSSTSGSDCIPPTPNSHGLNVLAVDTIQFCSDEEGASSTCSTGGLNPVPEPATLLLLGSGLSALAGRVAWRNRRQN